jgi:hypothetical protein
MMQRENIPHIELSKHLNTQFNEQVKRTGSFRQQYGVPTFENTPQPQMVFTDQERSDERQLKLQIVYMLLQQRLYRLVSILQKQYNFTKIDILN